MKKILISTGEHSGDMHAAALCEELQNDNLTVYAIGSQRLEKAGAILLDDLADKSTIGFLEVIQHIGSMLHAYRKIKQHILRLKPDLIIAVDFQGFNVPLLTWAKKIGFKTAYYICPQEWQWGTEKNGQKVAAVCDLMITIFPEAAEFYQKLGTRATYVGHPLLDMCQIQNKTAESKQTLAVYTGSRKQEHKHLIPLFIDTIRAFEKKHKLNVIFAAVNKAHADTLMAAFPSDVQWGIELNQNRELMQKADLALTASGTATLELALHQVPFVAAYRLNPISGWVIWHTVGKRYLEKTRYIALPNIIMKKEISPEFLQGKATVEQLIQGLDRCIDTESRTQILADFATLKIKLGENGAIKRAAQLIQEVLNSE